MNTADIVILAVIGAAVIWAIRHIQKKPSQCGGDCEHCMCKCKSVDKEE